jgi:Mg2+-importing ATPase
VAVPVDRLVPGDVVVLESRGAHCNEALMTEEPYPVDKYPGPCDATAPPEAFNALFAGTSIVTGRRSCW